MAFGLATYPGTAVYSPLGEGEIAGRIDLQPDSLLFHTEAGDVQCVLPFQRVEFTWLKSGQVQLIDPQQPDWQVYTADDRLLNHPLLRRHTRTRLQVQQLRGLREGKRRLKLTAAFLCTVLLFVIAAWALTAQSINLAVKFVPQEWEQALEDKALREVRKSPAVLQKPDWPEPVNELVDRLTQARPPEQRRFNLLLLEDPEPNARALPGGTILVNTGFLEFVKTPEEFAAMLAHEMAHVHCRHGMKLLISAVGPYYGLKVFIGDRNRLAELLGMHTALLLAGNYSRENEFEADTLAWRRLLAADVDPRGLISLLQRLEEEKNNGVRAKLEKILAQSGRATHSAYSTHPETAERLARLERLWAQSPKKTGFAQLPQFEWKMDKNGAGKQP